MKVFWGAMLGALLISVPWMWQFDRIVDRVKADELHKLHLARDAINDLEKRLANMSDFICGPKGRLVVGENSYTCKNK